jgi:hypothetical protein
MAAGGVQADGRVSRSLYDPIEHQHRKVRDEGADETPAANIERPKVKPAAS